MSNKIHIVTSREDGPVFATKNEELANIKVKEQEHIEAMRGGRPNVYIKELELV